jgi:ectoine hydroxylase-related dioxygenase (phytanoyl-CoA dioxygenase family)
VPGQAFREHICQPATKAGDVVLWSEATVHGATAWRGAHQRRIALYRFAPPNMGYGAPRPLRPRPPAPGHTR